MQSDLHERVTDYLGQGERPPPTPHKLWLDPIQAVGIELEWEDQYIRVDDELSASRVSNILTERNTALQHWGIKIDHSLRGDYPYEILTKGPKGGLTLRRAMVSYSKWHDACNINPCLSAQTSTHIHLDVRDWPVITLQKFVIFFALLEEHLFDTWGPLRKFSPFCIPLSAMNIEGLRSYINLVNFKNNNHPELSTALFRDIIRRSYKYSSLNLRSIYELGSLEIRVARGMHQPEEIVRYINTLFRITARTKLSDLAQPLYEFFQQITKEYAEIITRESYLAASSLFLLFNDVPEVLTYTPPTIGLTTSTSTSVPSFWTSSETY